MILTFRLIFLFCFVFCFLFFGCIGSLLLHVGFSLVVVSGGLLFVVVRRLLIVVASLVGSMGSRCAGFSNCGTRVQ